MVAKLASAKKVTWSRTSKAEQPVYQLQLTPHKRAQEGFNLYLFWFTKLEQLFLFPQALNCDQNASCVNDAKGGKRCMCNEGFHDYADKEGGPAKDG